MMHWFSQILLSCIFPLLGVVCWPLSRRWWPEAPAPLGLAFGMAIALGWLQVGGVLMGFTGMLNAPLVVVWVLGGVALALALGDRSWRSCFAVHSGWWLVVLFWVGYLLLATVPPWYRDAMTYHLSLPRFFAVSGGYAPTDDNIFASFPLGWESILSMLCALGMAPDRFPPINPRLLGAWVSLFGALATGGLAIRLGADRVTSVVCGALLLLVPSWVEFGTSCYVEPWLVLLTTIGLAATLQRRWGVAAVMAAFAVSVKYPGLAVALFMGLVLVSEGIRSSEAEGRAALLRGLKYAVFVAILGCPFYLRNLMERGNPLFPLAFGLFGGEGWDDWRAWAYGITLQNYGMGRTPGDLIQLPFRLFTTQEFKSGFEGSLGPVVGAAVVAGFHQARQQRVAAMTVGFVVLWSVFWASNVQQVRFFLPAVPPLLAVLAATISAMRWRRTAVGVVLGCSVLWGTTTIPELVTRQHTGAWLAGSMTEEEVLQRMLPESFVPHRELEAHVPEDGKVWLVWNRLYTYYIRRDVRVDCVFEGWRLEALLDANATPIDAHRAFKSEEITHLLINHRFFLVNDNAELEPGRTVELQRRFAALIEGGILLPKQEWGPVRLYAVAEVSP